MSNYLLDSVTPEINKAVDLVENLSLSNIDESTVFFDNEGKKIGELPGKRRYIINVETLPDIVKNAFIVTEDASFYEHSGVSLKGILRALWTNYRAGKTLQGASTISQQVARSFFLTPKKSIERKLREMMLAILIEKRFSKEEILSLYLNKIYFGNGAYGLEAAARTYFRKKARDLSLEEAALLAGLPKAPSRLDPTKNPKGSLARQKSVLRRLYEERFLNSKEYQAARKSRINIYKTRSGFVNSAPYFTNSVRQNLSKYIDDDTIERGLRVYTTLNLKAQRALEKSLEKGSQFLTELHKGDTDKFAKETSYAGIILDIKDGSVVSLVGGKDYQKSEFNRALYTKREIGELILPFLAAVVVERGEGLETTIPKRDITQYQMLKDKRIYDLASLASKYGYGSTYKLLRSHAVKIKRNDVGLLLGQEKLSPFQIGHLYSSFVNGGKKPPKFRFLDKLVDNTGKTLVTFDPSKSTKKVMKSTTAAVIAETLKDQRCFSQIVSSQGRRDDYMIAEMNERYIVIKWFGSERGKTLMPPLSKGMERKFALSAGTLNKLPCQPKTFKNISYLSKGQKSDRVWIPMSTGVEDVKGDVKF